MSMILAGGGEAHESRLVDEALVALLDNKRLLFIPHAIAPRPWSFDQAHEWVRRPAAFDALDIVPEQELEHLSAEYLRQFGAVYLMGGNTYRLLHLLRISGVDRLITRFCQGGGVVYGVSAGAIVLGAAIDAAAIGPGKDEDEIGLSDLRGLGLLPGACVAAHYVADSDAELLKLSSRSGMPVLGIPSTSGVVGDGTNCHVVGVDPVALFQAEAKTLLYPGATLPAAVLVGQSG